MTALPELMLAKEVAEYLRVSEDGLAQWRSRGYGPRWHRVGGKIMYKTSDVAEFIEHQAEQTTDGQAS